MKYVIVICCLLLVACENKNKADTEIKDAQQPIGFPTQQLMGVFQDTLPCNDCAGAATTLYLKPDKTYIMEQAHGDKKVVYNLGKWVVTDSVLNLTGRQGPLTFKLLNLAEIALLDMPDTLLHNHSATPVTLNRVITPFKPLQPVPVEGMFSAAGDTMNILVCATGLTYPVALAPSAMRMTTAYSKAVQSKKTPLYSEVEGHFELRPSQQDTTTQDFFVVERFKKFIPQQQCQ